VKIYRDGDADFPTYCGTGLEDYVGSAYGLGRHYGQYSGAPINIPPPPSDADSAMAVNPTFVSFYRWHLPDPIMFSYDLRVTIQQIGGGPDFKKGQEAKFEEFKMNHIAAGPGWMNLGGDSLGFALLERSDDYCATAFIYCRQPQPVARYKTDMAVREIGLLPVEEKTKITMSVEEEERMAIKFKEQWR
jgi:hypothetical protein